MRHTSFPPSARTCRLGPPADHAFPGTERSRATRCRHLGGYAILASMITDRLEFRTIGGAEDLLAEELGDAGLTGLALAERRVTASIDGPAELLDRLRLYSTASLSLGEDDEPDLDPLRRSATSGVISTVAPAGAAVTFRVGSATGSTDVPAGLRTALTERIGAGFG